MTETVIAYGIKMAACIEINKKTTLGESYISETMSARIVMSI